MPLNAIFKLIQRLYYSLLVFTHIDVTFLYIASLALGYPKC